MDGSRRSNGESERHVRAAGANRTSGEKVSRARTCATRALQSRSTRRYALHAECASPNDAIKTKIVGAMRDATKLGGEVVFAAMGSLARDGKVIDDARKYE